jgi:hypothetical protein
MLIGSTHLTVAQATNNTYPFHEDTVAGDYVILIAFGSATMGPPAGSVFNLLDDVTRSGNHLAIYGGVVGSGSFEEVEWLAPHSVHTITFRGPTGIDDISLWDGTVSNGGNITVPSVSHTEDFFALFGIGYDQNSAFASAPSGNTLLGLVANSSSDFRSYAYRRTANDGIVSSFSSQTFQAPGSGGPHISFGYSLALEEVSVEVEEELSLSGEGEAQTSFDVDFFADGEEGVGSILLDVEVIGAEPIDESVEESGTGDRELAFDVDFFEDGVSGVGSVELTASIEVEVDEEITESGSGESVLDADITTFEELSITSAGSVELSSEVSAGEVIEVSSEGSSILSEDATGFPEETISESTSGEIEFAFTLDFSQDGELGVGSVTLTEDVETPSEVIDEEINVNSVGSVDSNISITATQNNIEGVGSVQLTEDVGTDVSETITETSGGSVQLPIDIDFTQSGLSGVGSVSLVDDIIDSSEEQDEINVTGTGETDAEIGIFSLQPPVNATSLVEIMTDLVIQREIALAGSGSVALFDEIESLISEFLEIAGSANVDLLENIEADTDKTINASGSVQLIENVESPGFADETILSTTLGSTELFDEIESPQEFDEVISSFGVGETGVVDLLDVSWEGAESAVGTVTMTVDSLVVLPPVRFENLDFPLQSHYFILMILTPEI